MGTSNLAGALRREHTLQRLCPACVCRLCSTAADVTAKTFTCVDVSTKTASGGDGGTKTATSKTTSGGSGRKSLYALYTGGVNAPDALRLAVAPFDSKDVAELAEFKATHPV
jgi:hypothetical protein